MTEELKPCPFCGGEAYLTPQNGDPEDSHEVCCSNCGGYVWGDSKERALSNWNRRIRDDGGIIAVPRVRERGSAVV